MINGGVCLLGALPVLLDEQGCRAVWNLVQEPPWWWMGSAAALAMAVLIQGKG